MSAKKKDKYVFDFEAFLEGLAQLEHEQWTFWASNLLREEKRITKKRRERWEELLATNWEDIPQDAKEIDYEFASKVISMFAMNPFPNLLLIGEFILDAVYPEDAFFGSSDDPGVQYIDTMRKLIRQIKKIRGES